MLQNSDCLRNPKSAIEFDLSRRSNSYICVTTVWFLEKKVAIEGTTYPEEFSETKVYFSSRTEILIHRETNKTLLTKIYLIIQTLHLLYLKVFPARNLSNKHLLFVE